ncbi:2-oxoacid:acceptor oxidoreductase subunit alpha [Pseudomaricurvus alkylphenolicus]|uniref:2-oxoacid:acceptor oxidoreductase subunit alpha n=1 Tax=Pseudomaricurvus alkylphenolicus TaxID=1306991 RepID=UPI00197FA4C5
MLQEPKDKHSPNTHLSQAIIRFAGDSGDGIQATGAMFSHNSAALGHDISTLPDYPAEIRAPAGTIAGVSSFQLNFSSRRIHTPGDRPDVLVAMNPAAVKAHISSLRPGGTLIVNDDGFDEQALKLAGYDKDPREDGTLDSYHVHRAPVSTMTVESVKALQLAPQQAALCKNMYTLGLVCWLFDRDTDFIEALVEQRFAQESEVLREANCMALRAGYNFAETTEMFSSQCRVETAEQSPGLYRRLSGNTATALGLVAAAQLAQRQLMYCTYPITPASDILHELAKLRHMGVIAGQTEDEIAAMGAAVGAAYGGSLAVTGTSGPGVALKSEAIGLAVMTELPVVIINVQRGGPSTGLPTKTEQSDLLQAMYGRNGECPVVVLAPDSPADCFTMAMEACRLAMKYMTPVFLLSDGYIANGSEPWQVPRVDQLPQFRTNEPVCSETQSQFLPYSRNPETLARPWVVPGTPGTEHRIGGLEKQDGTGHVSQDPLNHEQMVQLREQKIAGIAEDIPELDVFGSSAGRLLVLGWGGTGGAIRAAVEEAQAKGLDVACAQLRYLNPFPKNLAAVLDAFDQVLIPELNRGQLRQLVRAQYLVDAQGLNKVQGQPFHTSEILEKIENLCQQPSEAVA